MPVCAMTVMTAGRQAAVADRQPYGVGAGRGQAAAGVLQHRRGDASQRVPGSRAAIMQGRKR